VLERWDQDASYRPKPLVEYFRQIGDARAKDFEEPSPAEETTGPGA
jgi:hypothetical protein